MSIFYELSFCTIMNKIFRRLPLYLKLVLIAVVPLAFTIILTLQLVGEKGRRIKTLNAYSQQIEISQKIIELAGEMQTELRYSYLHVLKNDRRDELEQQRAKTDSLIQRLKEAEDPGIQEFTNYTFLDQLPGTRENVDSLRIHPETVTSFYINSIYRLHTMSHNSLAKTEYLQAVNKEIAGQKLLAQMFSFYGIMRLNFYNVLYTKQNALGTLYGLRGVYDIYKSFEKELLLVGPPSVVSSYKNALETTMLGATSRYMDTVFSRYAFDSNYTADSWWTASQQSSDELKKIREDLRTTILQQLDELTNVQIKVRNRFIILLTICLLVIAGIIAYTVRVLNNMLYEIRAAAQKISAGGTGIELNEFPNDVIGKLSNAIARMDKNNRLLAETAQSIGKGKFDVPVHPRSKEDVLGNAIAQMKEDLKRFTEEQKQRQQQLTKAALYGQEKERTRIGEELHDNINQLLTSARLYLEHLEDIPADKRGEFMTRSKKLLELSIEEIRKLSSQLVSPGLRTNNLQQSICLLMEEILAPASIEFKLAVRNIDESALGEDLKLNVYRIIQEQLKNIVKYASATNVWIKLEKLNGVLHLVISDNGIGFDPHSRRSGGIGLTNIASRAETFNGAVDIISAPGHGCTLKVSLELAAMAASH